jgi:flagellar protein FlgJ
MGGNAMLSSTRRLILTPLLAVCATGAVLGSNLGVAEAATTSATIRVSGSLKIRSAPSSTSAPVATLRNRAKVAIACQVNGQYVRGSVRKTAQWDRLTNGRYVSHAYVVTKARIPACPPPAAPPAAAPVVSGPVGAMTQDQFIAASVVPAQRSQREFGVPASVTIAQAILESGWGRSGLAANDRNYFGMKCFNQGTIAVGCKTYRTYECDVNGVCLPTEASFRSYASVLDSFRDHGRLLATASRYSAAFNYPNDANQFIVEVHKAGYATSPTYAANVQRVMQSYNLYRYDLR